MKRKRRKTMEMPTGCDFVPLFSLGVVRPTMGTSIMHSPIPMAPTMNSQRRPYLSAVHMAFRVNRMPKVAFRALMRLLQEWLERVR
jgi:hypothetical protein